MSVTYTKLRDGSWGVRGPLASLRAGEVVTVMKRDGQAKDETVGAVMWSDPKTGVAIATLARKAGTSRRESSSPSGRCRECRGPITNASHHRAMGGLCGSCAFDEYDM